jgi:streptomycin 6-kinase
MGRVPLPLDDRGRPRLQPMTRERVATLGRPGAEWHDGLGSALDDLARAWGLTWRRPLPGGSASYVASATTGQGEPRVVKVLAPEPDLADEARVLAPAHGRGYVRLHAHDRKRRALLLEQAGPALALRGWSPEQQLTALLETLRWAWAAVDLPPAVGEEDKAVSLARLVRDLDERLGRPVDRAVLRAALDHAEALAGWTGPTVTVHGDPHPGNALRAPDGRGSGWLFVDPDGFRADPAYDVGVVLRDWSSHLRGPGARATLRAWCRDAAERTGVDPHRVWAWAFLERVSTGLYVRSIGEPAVARPFLDSATALL